MVFCVQLCVTVLTDQASSEAAAAVAELQRAGLSVALMVYATQPLSMLTNALEPLEAYGVVGAFTAPLNERALLSRMLRYLNRTRQTDALFAEVTMPGTGSSAAKYRILSESADGGASGSLLGSRDASMLRSTELSNGFAVTLPSRSIPRPTRTASGRIRTEVAKEFGASDEYIAAAGSDGKALPSQSSLRRPANMQRSSGSGVGADGVTIAAATTVASKLRGKVWLSSACLSVCVVHESF
jgi:hypothetical protein